MALSGIKIFKLLPNTNCRECGFATCLAFAMRVAAKKIEAEACPYLSDEAKETLGAASAPPIRLLEISSGEKSVKVGEELVMFRHEKKFFHKAAFAICIKDVEDENAVLNKLDKVKNINFERAGEVLQLDLIAVKSVAGNKLKFREIVTLIKNNIDFPLILISNDPEIVKAGLEAVPNTRPMIYSANSENSGKMIELAKSFNASLAVTDENGLETLARLSDGIKSNGFENIILNPSCKNLSESIKNHTIIRRLALEKNYKTFGHPTILYVEGKNDFINSVVGICKYASIIIFDDMKDWECLPLLTLRQNIFTDPQKPLQVDPGIYNVGEPDKNSPVFVTTNFSLTYFIVSTEIEGAGFSGHLIVVDAEGLSVLTAWSAGKFSGEIVGKFIKQTDITDRVSHRKLIIPGFATAISGELEDSIPEWHVEVGPQEASDLPSYLKEVWQQR